MYDIQKIISDLKQIAAECEKVTSGNVSHRIANIEHGILNIADYLENYCPLGWRPASELPPEEGEYIVKKEWGLARADLSHSKFENGKWSTPQVKWWCYPPEEE